MLPPVARYARTIEDAWPLAVHAQTMNLAYLWWMGQIDHDVASRAAINPPTWPLELKSACDASAYEALERRANLAIDESAGEAPAHDGALLGVVA